MRWREKKTITLGMLWFSFYFKIKRSKNEKCKYLFWEVNYKLIILYIVLYSVAFGIYSEYIDFDACYTILCNFLNLWNNWFILFLSTHPHPKFQLRKQESHTNRKSPEDTPTAAEATKLVRKHSVCFKQLNRKYAYKKCLEPELMKDHTSTATCQCQ